MRNHLLPYRSSDVGALHPNVSRKHTWYTYRYVPRCRVLLIGNLLQLLLPFTLPPLKTSSRIVQYSFWKTPRRARHPKIDWIYFWLDSNAASVSLLCLFSNLQQVYKELSGYSKFYIHNHYSTKINTNIFYLSPHEYIHKKNYNENKDRKKNCLKFIIRLSCWNQHSIKVKIIIYITQSSFY